MASFALGLFLFGYVLLMLTNPVRASFRDGWQCIRRYPVMWRTLAFLALANAIFLFAVRFHDFWRGGPRLVWMRAGWNDPGAWLTGTPDSLWWMPAGSARMMLESSILPGAEVLAGLFHCIVTTFPLAVFAALGFVFNRRRTRGILFRALRRRLGIWAWLLLLLVLVCAMATLAKAVLYFRPGWIDESLWFQWGPAVAATSALFETFFGVGVQAYLLLHAYGWVRGLTFDSESMREVAIRRLGAAAKWASIVLLVQATFIELPLVLSFLSNWPAPPDVTAGWLQVVRLAFAILLLFFCTMQAWLTFHGETLGRAWRAHWRTVWRHGWEVSWFLIIAALHCFGVSFLRIVVLRGVGEDTAVGILWTFVWPWIFGVVSAWLLASWVCLFKRVE